MERASRKPHRSRAMTTAAISKPKKPLFYQLTSEQFLSDLGLKLSDAQRRVYTYWKTIDPYGNRTIPICTKAIADALGLVQRTVQLALNKLASKKLIKWDKSHGLIAKFDDREGDQVIAKANTGSSKRSGDRERQLELNLGADSGTSKIINIIKKEDLIDQEENLKFQNTENSEISIDGHNENSEMSLEEAIALIRSEIPDELTQEQNDELTQEQNDELNAQSDLEPDIEYDFVPEKPKTTVEVDSFRRRVEDFVLKTLNKTFPTAARRAAYFRSFNTKSWKKWETDYKASLTPRTETANPVLQDPWRMVIGIEGALKCKDFEEAVVRLEALRAIAPELAAQTQERLGIKS